MLIIRLRIRNLVFLVLNFSIHVSAFLHVRCNSVKAPRSSRCFVFQPRQKHVIHFPMSDHKSRKDWAKNMDEYFMGLALDQAQKAASNLEVPIGAILVRPDYHSARSGPPTAYEILSASHNQVERGIDAVAHAEILCFRAASKRLSNWRLVNTTLYTTLEPCITCMAAAYAFRVDRIVYGARDFRLGAVESWIEWDKVMPKHPYHPNGRIPVLGGIREEECGILLKEFFKNRRVEEMNRRQDVSRDMNEETMTIRVLAGSWLSKVRTKFFSILKRVRGRSLLKSIEKMFI